MSTNHFSTLIVLLLFLTISQSCITNHFEINSEILSKTAIILPENPNSIEVFAAKELCKHLRLIYGFELPVLSGNSSQKYDQYFYVGVRPKDFIRTLQSEEAVYIIKGNKIFLFGEDTIQVSKSNDIPELENRMLAEVLQLRYNRTGTLFAVYNFLEKELGIKWIKPGDNGIFFLKNKSYTVYDKHENWLPRLIQRNIRVIQHSHLSSVTPIEFALTKEQSQGKSADELIWLRRMRFGYGKYYQFRHAFTNYWEEYKDSLPNVFALNAFGERRPLNRVQRVKMCPSNDQLVDVVVSNWLEGKKKYPWQNSGSLSGCENDSDGQGDAEWCHCKNCLALDSHLGAGSLSYHLTDRYVYFWNMLANRASKYQNDILVTGYAYEQMLLPPSRFKLADNILIEFIPRLAGDFKKTQELYTGWKRMGMNKMFFRPNDFHWHIGIAMGQERRVYQNLKLALVNGASGTDYDSMIGYWEGISDLTYFIVAKAHQFPEASFEELESDFMSVFGASEPYIRQYYKHWRIIFENKLIPADLELNDGINAVYFEWAKMGKLTQRIDEFYNDSDFHVTRNYLLNALELASTAQIKDYINRMLIANEHSRLTYQALLAGKNGNKVKMAEKASELINYRKLKKDSIDIDWNELFQNQHYHLKDQIGTHTLDFMKTKKLINNEM